jgi:hypothetical protein
MRSAEDTVMEMSWMETGELLGLNLLAAVLLALVVLDVLEHAMRQAWQATRSRLHTPPGTANEQSRLDIGIARPV